MSITSRSLARAALVALVATGCSTTSAPAPAAIPTTAPPASAPSSEITTQAAPTVTAGADQRCRLGDLTAGTTRPDGADNQQQIRIVWTNTSGRACTMTGFGGADLVSSPRSEDRYSLPRSDRPAATVRLAPGEQAHSTILFLPASSGLRPDLRADEGSRDPARRDPLRAARLDRRAGAGPAGGDPAGDLPPADRARAS